MAYININLTKYKVGHASHKVTALHDGGSEATLMTSSTFRKIPEHEHLRINPAENTYVSSVTGQLTPVKGSVEIYLTFHGDNGTSITFPHEVFIHDDIEHDFILGRFKRSIISLTNSVSFPDNSQNVSSLSCE